jgi:hypothetical protein
MIVRKNSNLFLNLFQMMLSTGIWSSIEYLWLYKLFKN